MTVPQPFNYQAFRHWAVQQIRTGNPEQVDLRRLLAPVISDILESALSSHDSPVVMSDFTPADSVAKQSASDNERLINSSRPDQNRPTAKVDIPDYLRQHIIELYQTGTPYKVIQDRVYNWYNLFCEIDALIHITDQFLAQTRAWQKRALQPLYVCLWITHKTYQLWQQGEFISTNVMTVIGVDLTGYRDILGYYATNQNVDTYLPDLLSDLKDRGVNDVLIICLDSVFERREIINRVYPQTHVHGSVMYLTQTCLLHIKGKDLIQIRRELKAVCQSSTPDEAARLWQTVKATWEADYPLVIAQWEQHWPDILSLTEYPDLIRNLTQNASLFGVSQELLDDAAKVNGADTTEAELLKSVCFSSMHVLAKRRVGATKWGPLLKQLSLVFGDRLTSN